MSIASELAALPLFQGIAEARLTELVAIFKKVSLDTGKVLFKPGDVATTFDVLTSGEVVIEDEGHGVRLVLRAVASISELCALTGIPHTTTATTNGNVEILTVPVSALSAFFDSRPGFVFYKNLLGLVSDKVRRDRSLLDQMRSNIIRTQKAMKQMRETVLAAKETEISKPLFESLDALIQNNRRANYRVSPTRSLPASVRLDNGRMLTVLEVSEGYLKLQGCAADLTSDTRYWAGVMVLPNCEILVSGSILREDESGVVVKLDTLVDEFTTKLDDYMTRLQLLEVGV
ncbi:MAG: cyclic nucleotide-binding domain-containing protein [Polyangiaceae bacterium]|nr:cyclic nucleotide-binding domain-containing protein [Polyangiaceae bacterium]